MSCRRAAALRSNVFVSSSALMTKILLPISGGAIPLTVATHTSFLLKIPFTPFTIIGAAVCLLIIVKVEFSKVILLRFERINAVVDSIKFSGAGVILDKEEKILSSRLLFPRSFSRILADPKLSSVVVISP